MKEEKKIQEGSAATNPNHTLSISFYLLSFSILTLSLSLSLCSLSLQSATMSHFGRSGPPDITDTYSLLVLNITFRKLSLPLSLRFSIQFLLLRFLNPNPNPNFGSYFVGTTADDLFPLFDKYGKVVDIFIPKDRRYCIFSISLLFSLMGRFDYSIFD